MCFFFFFFVIFQLLVSYIDNSSRQFDLKKELSHIVVEMHKHNIVLGMKGVQLPFDPEAA
jgi:hypothetical protein